ncbi:F420-dependent oxidoreductase [Intrasporangium chromatireducens Q5-1]|uniref:F420-dependent oxidoreductase n=1 Tax=Intrasporangium chromatireducens Q5-1 TaxID=584657 RepID=W9GMF9_9MICO|nr:TIGR03617 family F420-dependent LLM class oxidoreductase [Intrasporangium chromatireducens]EWT07300.1 F420-dependent oxidoreductase [Intrasporangium chromatireducens Q5-1]
MKIDARLDPGSLDDIRDAARHAESAGYGGLWTSETAHDPFLPLVVAAEHTSHIELGCAVAVAFARNPMTVANAAHDLQRFSGGRFTLGLGTQVRSHVERRFSMPWSSPAARLEEFIHAVRAILGSWEEGTPLSFEGAFYRHTLMTAMFRPEPHGLGMPRIIIGGVGPAMVRTAGRAADGLLVHAFSTPSYLESVVLPAVTEGLDARGTLRTAFDVSCRVFLATGRTEDDIRAATEAVRRRIAFYGSTPAYQPVLEHHGWGELGSELNRLSRTDDPDRWATMAQLVDDQVLGTFAVIAPPAMAGAALVERYSGIADRLWYYTPYHPDSGLLDEVTAAVRDSSPARAERGSMPAGPVRES